MNGTVPSFLIGLALLLTSIPFPLSTPGSGQAEDLNRLHRKAQQAQSAGDFDTAIEHYERLRSLRPEIAEIHANLGLLYFLTGRPEAAAAFEKALELRPDLPGVHTYLGILAFRTGRMDEALADLQKARDSDPSNPQVHFYLGLIHRQQGEDAAAVRHLERAAGYGAESDRLYYLGKSYTELALESHTRLQREFSASFYADLARAHYHAVQGEWQPVADAYEEALQKRPEDRVLQQRLEWAQRRREGEAPLRRHDTPWADLVDGITRFIDTPPSPEDARLEMHRLQEQLRTFDDGVRDPARRAYLLAESYQILAYLTLVLLEAQPNPARAHLLKAEHHESLLDLEGAIREYRRALALEPKLREVHLAIATLFWRTQRYEEAWAELQRELEISPDQPGALYLAGELLFLKGELEEAEKHFLRALDRAPGMASAHLGAARIHESQRRYEKALDHLLQAVRLLPDDATVRYRLYTVYQRLDREAEAEAELEVFRRLRQQLNPP